MGGVPSLPPLGSLLSYYSTSMLTTPCASCSFPLTQPSQLRNITHAARYTLATVYVFLVVRIQNGSCFGYILALSCVFSHKESLLALTLKNKCLKISVQTTDWVIRGECNMIAPAPPLHTHTAGPPLSAYHCHSLDECYWNLLLNRLLFKRHTCPLSPRAHAHTHTHFLSSVRTPLSASLA